MMKIILLVVLMYWVALEVNASRDVPEDSKNEDDGTSDDSMMTIMNRQRNFEVIRVAEVLTLRIIAETNSRAEELVAILENRRKVITKLFKILPRIIAYITQMYPNVDTIPAPLVSNIFLTTELGRGEEAIKNIPAFLHRHFQKTDKHADVDMAQLTNKKLRRFTVSVSQLFLNSTMLRITESTTFMEKELDKTQDMLVRLPEIINLVLKGPYDTMSEDRIREGYNKLLKM